MVLKQELRSNSSSIGKDSASEQFIDSEPATRQFNKEIPKDQIEADLLNLLVRGTNVGISSSN